MKFLQLLALAATVSAVAIEPRHHKGRNNKHTVVASSAAAATAAATSVAAAAAASSTTGATTAVATAADTNSVANGQTIVLFEVNGVPGNECLTFRNNGKSLFYLFLPLLRSHSLLCMLSSLLAFAH